MNLTGQRPPHRLCLGFALGVMLALSSCSDAGSRALASGTTKVYERTLAFGTQQDSIGVVDVAVDGDTVAMVIVYSSKSFIDHPGVPGGTGWGSTAEGGGYLLATSDDGGATFTTDLLLAEAGLSGEVIGLYLEDGKAWIVLLQSPPGLENSKTVFAYSLDLETRRIGPRLPFQDFSYLGGTAAVNDGVLTLDISRHGDIDWLDGYLGRQSYDLRSGEFTDHSGFVRIDGCVGSLYTADRGASWVGYGPCGEQMCRFSSSGDVLVPGRDCVPKSAWPGPFEAPFDDLELAETAAGVVAVYVRAGQAMAAKIEGGVVTEMPLGASPDRRNEYPLRPWTRLHLPLGDIITVKGKLVVLSAMGKPSHVEVPRSPFADDDAAQANDSLMLQWLTPLPNGRALAVYAADIGTTEILMALYVRNVAMTLAPFDAEAPASAPIPSCPSAVPATPLVSACALAAACFPTVDVRNCLNDWTTISRGPTPAALSRFIATTDCAGFSASYPSLALAQTPACTPGCVGDVATVRCATAAGSNHYIVDCAARGSTCRNTASLGVGCYDDEPAPCGGCDARGRMVECDEQAPLVTDCASFGTVCSNVDGTGLCGTGECTNASAASACVDGKSMSCLFGKDCEGLGLACTSGRGSPACEAPCAAEGCLDLAPCPPQSCIGNYLLIEVGADRAWVDCTTLGYASCTAGRCAR